MRDELAALVHEIWADWIKYVLSLTYQIPHDGALAIPGEHWMRWRRQMRTAFDELPEGERLSDYEQADKIIELLNDYFSRAGARHVG